MATTIGQAYVQILPSMQGISANIGSELSGGAMVSAGKQGGQAISKGMRAAMLVGLGAALTVAVGKFKAFASECIDAYNVQEEAETKLQTVMSERMNATDKQIQGVKDYASALQEVGVVGDEVALSGAQQLATFLNTDGALKSLMPAMENLAVQQNGVNVSSESMVNIGNLMGKVMQGQTGALKRVGITFSKSQEKVLKYGSEQERAAMLAQVITDNVGNMNEVMAGTDAGKVQQAKNTLGDLQEVLGQKLIPFQAQFYTKLAELGSYLVSTIIPFVTKYKDIIIAVGAGLLAIIPAMTVYNAVQAIKTAMDAAGATSLFAYAAAQAAALAPLLLFVAGVAAAVAAGVYLYKNWDKVKAKVKQLADAFKKKFTEMKTKVTTVFDGIRTKISNVVNKIKSVLSFSGLTAKVSKTFQNIKSKITGPIEKAKSKIKGIIDGIKNFFPLSVGKIFSNLRVPTISVDGGRAPFGIGGKGKKPHIGVEWNAAGGIVNNATLIGAGEAGGEAILPLDPFWQRMDAMADSITGGSMATGTVQIYLDSDKIGESVVNFVNGQVVRYGASPLMI